MPKKSSSAFDALLKTFGTEEDQNLFSQLAERNPEVLSYGLRQDDYSRKLDEHRSELEELQSWRSWRENNWDPEVKMTKAEREKQERLDALESEKADLESRIAAGGDMTFEDVERFGNEWLKKTGIKPDQLVTKDVIDAKTKEFQNLNAFTAKAALEVPYLNAKHEKEFGDLFDPNDFLKQATEAGQYDLKAFYEGSFVTNKRQEKMKSDYERQLKEKDEAFAAEKKAAEDRLARMAGMGPQGTGSPADTEGPAMGPLQRKMMGLDKPKPEGRGAPEVPLGDGAIAAHAAREFLNKAAGR